MTIRTENSSLIKLFRTKSVDYLEFFLFHYTGQKTDISTASDTSGPHPRVRAAFQLTYFTLFFFISEVGGHQELNQYSRVNYTTTMTHSNWCQLFNVYWHLTVQWSAFKGYKCQDARKCPPPASSDTQDTDNNQKSLVLFIVHSGIWQVTARSARCKNPTSTSASLQGEKASSKVIYLALIRGLLSLVIHCIFELAPELSFWQEHRQKKSRQSVIKSDKHKVNKRG